MTDIVHDSETVDTSLLELTSPLPLSEQLVVQLNWTHSSLTEGVAVAQRLRRWTAPSMPGFNSRWH